MKKLVWLPLACLALFSCNQDNDSPKDDAAKIARGIVDDLDPDMHFACQGNYSPFDKLQDSELVYAKNYQVTNQTNDSIRVQMYLLPKFTVPHSEQLMERRDDFLIQELLYAPGTCAFMIVNSPNYDPAIDNSPMELWDNILGGTSTYQNSTVGYPYWHKYPWLYPQIHDFVRSYKVAFIEFWIEDHKNPNAEHHWLAVEDQNSFNNYNTLNSGNFYSLPFTIGTTPPIDYYIIPNELDMTSGKNTVYYMMNGVTTIAHDPQYLVKGTFRYMPNVVIPSYPHANPDTTPGYIIKFEDF